MYQCKPIEFIFTNHQENQYYCAKGLKDESIESAIEKFQKLVEFNNTNENVEWVFKSYKQLAKIKYYQLRYDETLDYIAQLISMLPKLNGNYAEDSINKLLLRYMTCSDRSFVSKMYNIIVNQLQDSVVAGISGHRLWLRINLNRFYDLLEEDDLDSAKILIQSIKGQLDKVSELTRNSFALEVIAAEIEYSMRFGGSLSELSQFHRRSSQVTSTITHPRVMGVIWECGATVHFYRGQFEKARLEFYESFKNYDEAGSLSKKKILKYLGLCSMLTDSEVNPFESQETQTYAQLAEYQNLIRLITAYEDCDLDLFYTVLDSMKTSSDVLTKDRLFHIAEKRILHNLKLKVLSNYLNASKAVTYDYLIRKLGLNCDKELEDLLLFMANNGLVNNLSIDYVDRVIEVNDSDSYSIFSPAIEKSAVKTHLSVLHDLGYCGPWTSNMITEDRSISDLSTVHNSITRGSINLDGLEANIGVRSNVYDLLFCETPLQQRDKTDPEEWFTYMSKAIPAQKLFKSSQRAHVISNAVENKDVSDVQDQDEEEMSKPKTGILGQSLGFWTGFEAFDDETSSDKLDILMEVTNSLRKSLRT